MPSFVIGWEVAIRLRRKHRAQHASDQRTRHVWDQKSDEKEPVVRQFGIAKTEDSDEDHQPEANQGSDN
jgi:hypothetical protein